MPLKIGQNVCWQDVKTTDPAKYSICEGTVVSVWPTVVIVSTPDGKQLRAIPEAVWPNTAEVRSFLLSGIQLHIKQFKELQERKNAILQFRNQLIRDGKL